MGISPSSPKTKEIIKSVDTYTQNASMYRAFNLSTCIDETPIKVNHKIKNRNVTPFINKINTPDSSFKSLTPLSTPNNILKPSSPPSISNNEKVSLNMNNISPEPGFNLSMIDNESLIPGTDFTPNRRSSLNTMAHSSSPAPRRSTFLNTPSRSSPLLSPPITFHPTITPAKGDNLPSIESIEGVLSTLANDWNSRSAV